MNAPCYLCYGTGVYEGEPCSICGGDGIVTLSVADHTALAISKTNIAVNQCVDKLEELETKISQMQADINYIKAKVK